MNDDVGVMGAHGDGVHSMQGGPRGECLAEADREGDVRERARPVTVSELSDRMKQTRSMVSPDMPILACAVCGRTELNEMKFGTGGTVSKYYVERVERLSNTFKVSDVSALELDVFLSQEWKEKQENDVKQLHETMEFQMKYTDARATMEEMGATYDVCESMCAKLSDRFADEREDDIRYMLEGMSFENKGMVQSILANNKKGNALKGLECIEALMKAVLEMLSGQLNVRSVTEEWQDLFSHVEDQRKDMERINMLMWDCLNRSIGFDKSDVEYVQNTLDYIDHRYGRKYVTLLERDGAVKDTGEQTSEWYLDAAACELTEGDVDACSTPDGCNGVMKAMDVLEKAIEHLPSLDGALTGGDMQGGNNRTLSMELSEFGSEEATRDTLQTVVNLVSRWNKYAGDEKNRDRVKIMKEEMAFSLYCERADQARQMFREVLTKHLEAKTMPKGTEDSDQTGVAFVRTASDALGKLKCERIKRVITPKEYMLEENLRGHKDEWHKRMVTLHLDCMGMEVADVDRSDASRHKSDFDLLVWDQLCKEVNDAKSSDQPFDPKKVAEYVYKQVELMVGQDGSNMDLLKEDLMKAAEKWDSMAASFGRRKQHGTLVRKLVRVASECVSDLNVPDRNYLETVVGMATDLALVSVHVVVFATNTRL